METEDVRCRRSAFASASLRARLGPATGTQAVGKACPHIGRQSRTPDRPIPLKGRTTKDAVPKLKAAGLSLQV
jgi:hypothetical protein